LNITELSIEQLKALAYDQIVLSNQAQRNIAAIEAELDRRRALEPQTITPTLAKSSDVPLHEITPQEQAEPGKE